MQRFDDDGPIQRGVYRARWLKDGHPVLIAITSRHERLTTIVVLREGVSEERAFRWLTQILDRLDPPPPPLRLVKPTPQPRLLTIEQLDALYRDANPLAALLYRRKLEKLRGMLHPAPR